MWSDGLKEAWIIMSDKLRSVSEDDPMIRAFE